MKSATSSDRTRAVIARDPSPSQPALSRAEGRLGMTQLSTRRGMTRLTRSIGLLPQHVLQCPLFLGVDGQELSAQMGVVAVALDVGLALGDGVVEQHEL